jgi:hypothetical protein
VPDAGLQNLMLRFAGSTFGIVKRSKTVGIGMQLPLSEYVIDAGNFGFVRSLNAELVKLTLA